MPDQDDSFRELEAEHRSIRLQFRLAAGISLSLLLIGAVFYHLVEHLSWLNSFYFCTITLTTIGYGDIVPTTDLGKLFTIFYVLIGIGILGFFVQLLVKNATIRRQLKQAKKKH